MLAILLFLLSMPISVWPYYFLPHQLLISLISIVLPCFYLVSKASQFPFPCRPIKLCSFDFAELLFNICYTNPSFRWTNARIHYFGVEWYGLYAGCISYGYFYLID